MKTHKTIQALFLFPGFRALNNLQGKFGDPKARIIVLQRRKKQPNVLGVTAVTKLTTIASRVKHVTWIRVIIVFMCGMKGVVYFAEPVTACA